METFIKVRLKDEAKKQFFFPEFAGLCKNFGFDPNGVFFVRESEKSSRYVLSIFLSDCPDNHPNWSWSAIPGNWEVIKSTPKKLEDFA